MGLTSHNNWTHAQTSLLWQLTAEKKSAHEIAAFLGRSEEEIQEKASELGMLLKSEDDDPLKALAEEYLKELEEEILEWGVEPLSTSA